MNEAAWILAGVVVAQLGVIYGLVNRLLMKEGQRPMRISREMERHFAVSNNAPVEHPKVVSGKQRVTV